MTETTRAITANTAVSVGMLLGLVGAVFTGARWAGHMEAAHIQASHRHENAIKFVELKLEQLRSEIRNGTDDRYRRSDALAYHQMTDTWTQVLAARNPELYIPEWPEMPQKLP